MDPREIDRTHMVKPSGQVNQSTCNGLMEYNDDPSTVHLCISCGERRVYSAMVRKKKLSPSGAKDEEGEYHNVHVNLHEDELAVAGMEIGDEVFVRVRDGKIIIQKADSADVEHEF